MATNMLIQENRPNKMEPQKIEETNKADKHQDVRADVTISRDYLRSLETQVREGNKSIRSK